MIQDNNFKTKIELYQANIDYLQRDKNILDHFCEKMEFDNEATYMQDFSTLVLTASRRPSFINTITENC